MYKLSEAFAWELARSGSAEAAAALDRLTALVAAAQHSDGYLNTTFGNPGQPGRYTDLEWGHELYCYGFLIQAAIARTRVQGDNELITAARRAADHVYATFGPGWLEGVCGHPEIEMALVELARLTGEQRYLDQAALFVDRRGHGSLVDTEFGPVYFSDDVPVREARPRRPCGVVLCGVLRRRDRDRPDSVPLLGQPRPVDDARLAAGGLTPQRQGGEVGRQGGQVG